MLSTPQSARKLRMSSIGEDFHPNRQFIRICPWKVQKLDLEEFVDPPRGVPQIANSSGETSPKQLSVVRPEEDKDATCWPVPRHQHDLREAITYTDACWGSRLDTRHRPTFRRALTSRTSSEVNKSKSHVAWALKVHRGQHGKSNAPRNCNNQV